MSYKWSSKHFYVLFLITLETTDQFASIKASVLQKAYFHISPWWESLLPSTDFLRFGKLAKQENNCNSITWSCWEMDNTFDSDVAYYSQALEINHVIFLRW